MCCAPLTGRGPSRLLPMLEVERAVRSKPVYEMRITQCLSVGALVAVAGCAHVRPPEPLPRILQFHVLPASLELAVGESATLVGYIAADAGVADRTVLWSSTDTLVASVNSQGLVLAKSLGIATIVASAEADPTFRAISVVGVLSDDRMHIPDRKR